MSPDPSSSPPSSVTPRRVALLPWVGLLLLAVWTAHPVPWWLLASAGALIVAALPAPGRERASAAALVLLLAAVVTGFVAHHRLASINRDFEGYWGRRESEVANILEVELDQLLAS